MPVETILASCLVRAAGARRLLDALQRGPPRQHLALPLLVLVAQQRQAIMVRTEAQHIKFVVELYDKCHETTTQYIEFLQVRPCGTRVLHPCIASVLLGPHAVLPGPTGDPPCFNTMRPLLRLTAHPNNPCVTSTPVQTALPFEDYCKLLPQLDVLRTAYKLDSEIVFQVRGPCCWGRSPAVLT